MTQRDLSPHDTRHLVTLVINGTLIINGTLTVNPNPMTPPMITEQQARERERKAFQRCVSTMYGVGSVPIGALDTPPEDASCEYLPPAWTALAKRTFPDVPTPKVRVPVVTKDGGFSFRTIKGEIFHTSFTFDGVRRGVSMGNSSTGDYNGEFLVALGKHKIATWKSAAVEVPADSPEALAWKNDPSYTEL